MKNTGKSTLTLTGYVLRDSGPKKFAFPKGTKLKAGKTLTIRTGKGKNTASTLYWNNKGYVWNNTGDTARTYNAKGKLLESCTYKGGKHPKATRRRCAPPRPRHSAEDVRPLSCCGAVPW